ncbi:MAG: hypothetical protein M1365_05765, partial [Actinobacteria bacterium]|nr:hypothetical protein [Actinomycetota bacterium]
MRKFIGPSLLLLLVIIIFRSWFFPGVLSTFDFLYFSPSMMKNIEIIPYAWGWHIGFDGMPRFISPYSWIFPLINIPLATFSKLGMGWAFIERVAYLYPLLALMLFSPILLFKQVIPNNKFYLLSIIIFSFNTYSLLLAAGQVFFALAFMLAPIVLTLFIYILTENLTIYKRWIFSIITGLVLTVQVMVDPRITYVTVFVATIYFLFYFVIQSYSYKKYSIGDYASLAIFVFLIPGLIVITSHAFWIIPSLLHGGNPVETLGSSYSTVEAVKYLSFAKLENTISLLHPNWPENIFGKVYFMRPEFLLIPILAFSSIFFVRKLKNSKEKINILFFGLLGILGAFLSKGSNEPFGGIYLWLFKYLDGFIMFRDPAKWYLLIAISYSILIPFTAWMIYEWLKAIRKFSILNFQFPIKGKLLNLHNLFLVLTVLYLIFLIKPAITGQLTGMLKTTSVPDDYIKLENFLVNQNGYFRTLWVPARQKFGYYSNNKPEISAQTLFNTTDNENLVKKLTEKKTEKLLKEISVKYVIIPYDSEKEIFITDRDYDNLKYEKKIKGLKKITWLKEVYGFNRIKVYEIMSFEDHFWSPSKD